MKNPLLLTNHLKLRKLRQVKDLDHGLKKPKKLIKQLMSTQAKETTVKI